MAETQYVTNSLRNLTSLLTGGTSLTNNIYKTLTSALDTMSQSIGTIDLTHRRIHEGKHFIYTVRKTCTASTDFLNVWLKGMGSTKKKRHLVVDVSADKAGDVTFIEGGLTSGAGGATVVALNSNRGSTIASEHKIIVQPTTKSSESATTIWGSFIGANAPPTRIGGSIGIREEIIANSSENYHVRFNPGSAATKVLIVAEYYEV